MSAALEARGIALSLGELQVLRGVSLSLEPGDFAALLGPNGSGKTTLLRVMLGFVRPDAGEILLDGRPMRDRRRRQIARRVAYVPQAHTPSFPFTVREIVQMGRTPEIGWGRRPGAEDDAAVSGALHRLGLLAFAERPYSELSGGERQAVLISRALAQGARTLLMDEPTASLDLGQQTRLMALLSGLAEEGYAILVSVHQPELALRWFNRALLLHRGEVMGDGEPAVVLTAEALSELYGVEVKLVPGQDGPFLWAAAPLP